MLGLANCFPQCILLSLLKADNQFPLFKSPIRSNFQMDASRMAQDPSGKM